MSLHTHTPTRILVTVALAFAGLGIAASPAHAATCDPANPTQGDINSDLRADIAVGVPTRSSSAGAVDLRYDDDETPATTVTAASLGLPASAKGDRFGAAVLVDDINADGCADLVIGAPGASKGSGAVYLAYGSDTGIVAAGATRIASPSSGARFGEAVGVTHSGAAQQLLVGAPGYDSTFGTTTVKDSGTVFGASLGTTGTIGAWSRYGQGARAEIEAGDQFGAPLVASGTWFMVGTPLEDVAKVKDAGKVTVFMLEYQRSGWGATHVVTITQDTAGVPGVAEKSDKFGAAISLGDPLAVGVPGEDIGGKKDTGMVQRFTLAADGTPTFLSGLDQNSPGVPDKNENGDQWGAAVASGVDNNDLDGHVLYVGAPGEDIGSKNAAGAVTQLYGFTTLTGTLLRQGAGLPGSAESGDKVGATVGIIPDYSDASDDIVDRVLIGAPGENVGSVVDAGEVVFHSYVWNKWTNVTFVGGAKKGLKYGSSLGYDQ
jgi:hypothetical protein